MTEKLIFNVNPESLRELLQQGGYRVDQVSNPIGNPRLQSATSGLPFEVHFGNGLPDGKGEGFVDMTFVSVFRVQGDLPLSVVNGWNNRRRFSRLHLVTGMLILEMDISVIGGVTTPHLLAQITIWDRLVQELGPYLREAVPAATRAKAADDADASEKENAADADRATPAA